jgi:hypothetical protein
LWNEAQEVFRVALAHHPDADHAYIESSHWFVPELLSQIRAVEREYRPAYERAAIEECDWIGD